jgi:hypothetical protein
MLQVHKKDYIGIVKLMKYFTKFITKNGGFVMSNEELYKKGWDDCDNNRIPNDSLGEDYCRGYGNKFAEEQQLSQGGFN